MTNNIDPLLLLAEDRELVTYRKSLNKITGGVTSTILLQQVLYWSKKRKYEPFYKFKAGCKHDTYKPGDSWTEELGFGLSEFDTALKRIGTKVTRGASKAKAFEGKTAQHLVVYWTDSSRITWYQLNVNLLRYMVNSIYLEEPKIQDTYEGEDSDLPLTETTLETTNKENNNSDDVFKKVVNLYEQNIGSLSPIIADMLKEDSATYPYPIIEEAVIIALAANVRKWSYVRGALKRMAVTGYQQPQANGTAKPTPGFFTDLEPETVVAEPVYDDPDIVTLIGSKKEQLPFLDEIKIQLEKGKRVFYARTEMELNALKRCRDLPRYFDQPVELRLSQ